MRIKKSHSYLLLTLLVILAVIAGYFLYNSLSAGFVWKKIAPIPVVQNFKYISQLTGRGVNDETLVLPRVVAVMVDNHPAARPQTGLEQASVVYEAPVEGGITRFLAIYPAAQEISMVGPVRSARPYYLDWLHEYGDPLYLHCGGSATALDLLKQGGVFDLNEFYNGPYFWREPGQTAPHNLYTGSVKWNDYLANNSAGHEANVWSGWKFGGVNVTSIEPAQLWSLKGLANETIGWSYDGASGRYQKLLAGQPVKQASGEMIWADNVIVQIAEIKVLDEVGRREIKTIGTGEARIFRDGQMIRGTWKKNNPVDRTRFYDAQNTEINLKPGQTWLEIAPKSATVEILK